MQTYTLFAHMVPCTIMVGQYPFEDGVRPALLLQFHHMGYARRDGKYWHWIILGFLAAGWHAGVVNGDIVAALSIPDAVTKEPLCVLCDVGLHDARLEAVLEGNNVTVGFGVPLNGAGWEEFLLRTLPTSAVTDGGIVLHAPITRSVDRIPYLGVEQHGMLLAPPPLPVAQTAL